MVCADAVYLIGERYNLGGLCEKPECPPELRYEQMTQGSRCLLDADYNAIAKMGIRPVEGAVQNGTSRLGLLSGGDC